MLSVPLTGPECSGHETGYSRGKKRREGKVNRGGLWGGGGDGGVKRRGSICNEQVVTVQWYEPYKEISSN
jgi:hypothetical protein